jgi:nitrogen fixation/metabolism regulation signal transduction histidine kinase
VKGSGSIQRRLALAIVLTALIPVLVAIWLGEKYVRETGARYFVPEIGQHLDRSLGLYQELARTLKARMRAEAQAIALSPALGRALATGDAAALEQELRRQIVEHPSLVSLEVQRAGGEVAARADRGRALDEARENQLEVRLGIGEGAVKDADDEDDEASPRLIALFSADKARFDELAEMGQFIDAFKLLDRRRQQDLRGYVLAFAALLGITIVAAVSVGSLLARDAVVRLGELARATERVASGNLSIRVEAAGNDEITALARAFNRMLSEVETSRARIEYLQRISAWQEMARRLAHEIKNPLTPIQLGVQEIHRRYSGDDAHYRALLDTTLEIVEDEVGTLRRLVSEFSGFARLPQAHLELADLTEFMAEQRRQIERLTGEGERDSSEELSVIRMLEPRPSFEWCLPEQPLEAEVDRQMLRRVLLNLIQNAADALAAAGTPSPKILVELARQDDGSRALAVEDNGPGVAPELGDTIFDPYVTTKRAGTGLGLAISKKIVVEHGGSITAGPSELGGARLRVTLPDPAARRAAPPAAERTARAAAAGEHAS